MLTMLFYLSSGFFLGWSLGANDAANVFGTAVGTKMVRFKTAAIICSVFVVLGAVASGAGASHTLGKLGSVNEIAGAFIVAFSGAITITGMTKLGLPVSTSQAIVGAIIGWNFFSGSLTDYSSLTKIVGSWIMCPILSAIFALILFKILKLLVNMPGVHMFSVDTMTRLGLILVGAFGSYSLGANNIANVMGVFVEVSPFKDINMSNALTIKGVDQLFFLGALCIAVGVYTYSYRVMSTVGGGLIKLSPIAAFVAVLSHSIVLFLFASENLENWLLTHGLPAIPLVPVSSSQAVVGAILGIGIAMGAKNINFAVLGRISMGWVTTPIISCLVCFVTLFFMQNTFNQIVYTPINYMVSKDVVPRLEQGGLLKETLRIVSGDAGVPAKKFLNAVNFEKTLDTLGYTKKEKSSIMELCEVHTMKLSVAAKKEFIGKDFLSPEQMRALETLEGKSYRHRWQLAEDLAAADPSWKYRDKKAINKIYNKNLKEKYDFLIQLFHEKTRRQR